MTRIADRKIIMNCRWSQPPVSAMLQDFDDEWLLENERVLNTAKLWRFAIAPQINLIAA
jgi:hypothetical protein